MFWQEKSSKLIWIFALTWKLKQVYMNLCFDKRNQSDQYLQVTYYIFSNQICFLTGKIQKIDLNFVFWQVKSNKFICICVLTEKNSQLIWMFLVEIQTNHFEFAFWQEKSIWSIFTGYFLYFFKSNLLFDRNNLGNWFEFCIRFAFWQEKSIKWIWILCFDT